MQELYSDQDKKSYSEHLDKMSNNPRCYNEALRPQFHFSPMFNWCNDPNGLVYCQGEYHLFFQHNPVGLTWGNMSWGHAVSRDLIHWKQLPVALWPDESGSIYSGSGIVDSKNTGGFKTGDHSPIVLAYTAAGSQGNGGLPFTQSLAFSNDLGRTWKKYMQNPILPNQSGGDDRDPKILWCRQTEMWVMVLYLDQGRKIGFYVSPDLKDWTYTCEVPDFYECPDLFCLPLDGDPTVTMWILMGAKGDYVVGQFDGYTFLADSSKQQADCGANFYAPQTFNGIPESDDRRIQIAWMDGGHFPDMPFNQQMSIPCELSLRTFPDGIRLCREPVRELQALRCDPVILTDLTLTAGSNSIIQLPGDLLDLVLEIDLKQASGFELRIGNTIVLLDKKSQSIQLNGVPARLPMGTAQIHLRILIDRSSTELFADHGRLSMTSSISQDCKAMSDLVIDVPSGTLAVRSVQLYRLNSIWNQQGPLA